tara:strand:- start:167664 stop:168425 length:762 start_codon:yes stop_codon:yes gene_type:complete
MNWLLLRGLGREQRHWGKFEDILRQQEYVDEVLCIDLPGFGDHRADEAPLTIEETTEYLRTKFLDQIDESKQWGLCAISLGGMIGMDWLARFPKDFAVATLLNTSAANYSAPWKRFKAYNFIHPHILKERAFGPKEIERMILSTISNKHSHNNGVIEEWTEIRINRPYDPVNVARQLAGAAIFQAKPERIHVPTLFLCSAQDRLVDCSCTLNLAKDFKDGYIHIHPTAGHEITLDEPEWVCEKMKLRFANASV